MSIIAQVGKDGSTARAEEEVQPSCFYRFFCCCFGGAGSSHERGGGSGIRGDNHLLKPQVESEKGRHCLVLDLDETLVHSSFKPIANADFIIPVEIEDQVHQVYGILFYFFYFQKKKKLLI